MAFLFITMTNLSELKVFLGFCYNTIQQILEWIDFVRKRLAVLQPEPEVAGNVYPTTLTSQYALMFPALSLYH